MTEYEYQIKKEQRLKKKRRRLIIITSELVVVLFLLILLIVRIAGRDSGEGLQNSDGQQKITESVADAPADIKTDESGNAVQGDYGKTDVFMGGIKSVIDEQVKTYGEEVKRQEEAKQPTPTPTEIPVNLTFAEKNADIIEKANLSASMYDYDRAIELISSADGFEGDEEAAALVAEYNDAKSKLVLWPDNTQISHLFVHSLIVDTSRAFGKGSSQPKGYNQYMTTVSEFNSMIEQMYEKGYVLVSIHDIAKRVVDEEGNEKLVKNDIWLPEGKTPFVLSQDDVNYYLYMEGDGFADRLVIGEDGIPTCQYTDTDGTVKYGEYDTLPIIDRFVKEHPDFSYHGAKGILAVTGYEGALGYDTGLSMKKYDGMTEDEKMALIEAERAEATAVADAIKADGWEFASHSYTHSNMTDASLDKLKYDTTRWHDEVEPILGPTDIYIYPYGADICDWRGYKGDKFELLKSAGFWYFCNVDGSRYWIQMKEQYFRMGRINADGERMYKTPERLEYFFDVDSLYDKTRPAF